MNCKNPECNKEFTPRVGRQKFCQVKCQSRYFNQLRKGKPRFEITKEFTVKCKELRTEGLTIAQIARKLNVSTTPVFKVVSTIADRNETNGYFSWGSRYYYRCIITGFTVLIRNKIA